MNCLTDQLWVNNISMLFCNSELLPLSNISFNKKINAVTRLVIIIFLMISIFNIKYGLYFLLSSLIIILIITFLKKKENYKENYNNMTTIKPKHYKKNNDKNYSNVVTFTSILSNKSDIQINKDKQEIGAVNLDKHQLNNKKFVSLNQRYAGPANPKTKKQPVVPTPSHDLNYWKNNDMVLHSRINDHSNTDLYRSGYQVMDNCDNRYYPEKKVSFKEDFKLEKPTLQQLQSKSINLDCGYEYEQTTENGLPNNLSAGDCMKMPYLKQHNQNMFTTNLQPDIYDRNMVNEPINSNIGISMTPQFNTTLMSQNENTQELLFTQNDIITQDKQDYEITVNETNVYDPRFTGYGTSYRSYLDNTTGQTRFYYDDIDNIKMPTYITRNHIDSQSFGDTYGPLKQDEYYGNKHHKSIKQMADDAYTDNMLKHRTELQQRLLRKNNARQWQQRMAPINKHSQRMLGGTGRI